MRRIAVLNQKGGVGKTTTTVNLAAALALAGFKTQILDLDPQAHATLHLGLLPGRSGPSLYEVLTEGLPLAKVRRPVGENLWICGSHIDLAGAELELLGTVGREVILRDQLNADTEEFDFVLMDCPPSLSVLTLNALCAATEVLIPLQAHFLALHGLSKLLETVNLVSKRVNRELKVGGIVLCLYDAGTRHGSEVIEDLSAFFDHRRKAECALGRRQAVPDPNSPQHPAGRVSQLRPIDLPVRPHQPGRRGLRLAGRRDPGPPRGIHLAGRRRQGGRRRLRPAAQGSRSSLSSRGTVAQVSW